MEPAAVALTISVTAALVISTLCSLFEAVLYSSRVSVIEAAHDQGQHRRAAERFLQMKNNIDRPTAAILILNTLAHTVGATLSGVYAAIVFGEEWVVAFSMVLTLAILYLSEIAPKTYGATHWNGLWRFTVWPLHFIQRALAPLIWLTQHFSQLFSRGAKAPLVTEEEVLAMIRMGRKSGQFSPTEQQLLRAVFSFDDMYCRQIMVPRLDVQFLDVSWPLEQCLAFVRKNAHTRYPLCHGSLHETVGFIHVKDLLGLPSDQPFDPKSIVRPVRYVPETVALSRLMREMQQSKQHMSLVVDEFGAVSGAVFLEDVLEQIVGAMQDEFDVEKPDLIEESPGQYLAAGRIPIDQLNRELRLSLPQHEVETLSGLVMTSLGRMPLVGDRVELDGVAAEVTETHGPRASQVRLVLAPPPGHRPPGE
jgi:CBS domain containing-hemolysin-like protein